MWLIALLHTESIVFQTNSQQIIQTNPKKKKQNLKENSESEFDGELTSESSDDLDSTPKVKR